MAGPARTEQAPGPNHLSPGPAPQAGTASTGPVSASREDVVDNVVPLGPPARLNPHEGGGRRRRARSEEDRPSFRPSGTDPTVARFGADAAGQSDTPAPALPAYPPPLSPQQLHADPPVGGSADEQRGQRPSDRPETHRSGPSFPVDRGTADWGGDGPTDQPPGPGDPSGDPGPRATDVTRRSRTPGPERTGRRRQETPADILPQRIPAEPDVPTVPEPPAVDSHAAAPELARIATHLRREEPASPTDERPDGFDVQAILGAVRGVPGVRDAALRTTPAGAHSLRLELADGADPAEVSRQVARLLQERMGLAAAPQDPPPAGLESGHQRTRSSPSGSPERRRPSPTGPAAPGTAAGRAVVGGPTSCASAPAGRPTEVPPGSTWPASPPPASAPPAHSVPASAPPAHSVPASAPPAHSVPASAPPAHSVPASAPPLNRDAGSAVRPVDAASIRSAEPAAAIGPVGAPGTSYAAGQHLTTTETAPSRPLNPNGPPGPRVLIDHVQVSTFGLEATVEVRLSAGDQRATGLTTGPAVDGYVLRLCAASAALAIDQLLRSADRTPDQGRCFVEHAAVLPFGSCEVATVVVLLVCDGWVEQLAGSALVAGDPRQAIVRATLAAVNRRLEALLAG
ncbi:hypothetical protein [Plantactinospora sp. GCM10030261]|uniref:hypothetical protein n=1 Tax=Plantactinospora sp. GCM10030261 TaxID=3273420 RepID=UPI00361E26E9